mmetsp:Transcript_7678/g.18731  ORF Transcript_7678/g.18731 Transcript_7678/m.18731 type:complete len:266 (+) Transcript_7678:672-1469(+)
MNSPRLGSRMNLSTPLPNVITSSVALPYMQYPAAIRSVPGRRMSSGLGGLKFFFSKMLKMVPVETLQSMLEDPSRGSKATQNFAWFPATGQRIGSGSSSDTSTAHTPLFFNALTTNMLERRSSFFTESPDLFFVPAIPRSPEIPALRTARAMFLHAISIAVMRRARSLSLVLSMMNEDSVSRSASTIFSVDMVEGSGLGARVGVALPCCSTVGSPGRVRVRVYRISCLRAVCVRESGVCGQSSERRVFGGFNPAVDRTEDRSEDR